MPIQTGITYSFEFQGSIYECAMMSIEELQDILGRLSGELELVKLSIVALEGGSPRLIAQSEQAERLLLRHIQMVRLALAYAVNSQSFNPAHDGALFYRAAKALLPEDVLGQLVAATVDMKTTVGSISSF